MGQRSQIYVRINDESGAKHLVVARYFGWNYGTRMVSRARYTIEWLQSRLDCPKYFLSELNINGKRICEGLLLLNHVVEINFDYKDVVRTRDLIEEFFEDNHGELRNSENFIGVFEQDNNDGKFFLDVYVDYETEKVTYRYAFTDSTNEKIMDAIQYMDWDEEGWRESEYISKKEVKYTEKNAKYIAKNAELMTFERLQSFIQYDYLSTM